MTTPINEPPLCGVCKMNKTAHETMNHEFNEDGKLIQKKKVPELVVRPGGAGAAQLTGLLMRLVHVLVRKGLLTDDDVKYITAGPDEGPRSSAADSQVGVYPARPPG